MNASGGPEWAGERGDGRGGGGDEGAGQVMTALNVLQELFCLIAVA